MPGARILPLGREGSIFKHTLNNQNNLYRRVYINSRVRKSKTAAQKLIVKWPTLSPGQKGSLA